MTPREVITGLATVLILVTAFLVASSWTATPAASPTPASQGGEALPALVWETPRGLHERATRSRTIPGVNRLPGGVGTDVARKDHPRRREASRRGEPAPGIVLPWILKRIRGCESGSGPDSAGDYRARNAHSTASGAYQALDGTWHRFGGYARAYLAPRAVQDTFALRLWRRSGTSPWNASRGCWS